MCRSEINCINLSKVILESKGIIAILIALSFVIAPAIIQIASEFIPYPKMPF